MVVDLQRENALLHAAARLTGEARTSFLEAACQGEPALRGRLEDLLAAQQPSNGLPGEAAPAAAGTLKLDFSEETVDEAVGTTIGRYKILERVGEGGCGLVYVAEQTEPVRRRVAVKVIKLGMDTKAVVARFEAERQALAMMDHPNIAKVLDAGATETGRPYFVMELVRGIKITDYCDRNNLSTKDRLDLFIKVCQAIQHAHQKGIIHRDIKPSNILVTLHDGLPVPKVIDFGIAKATEGRLTDATVYTQLNQFIGTPAYMSPEQAEMSGLDIDTRSDIYSLGVLLYELLTGRTPFDPQDLMSHGIDGMRRTIRETEPLRPSTKLATLKGEELTTTAKCRGSEAPRLINLVRGDLDWIVMKCLEKDRTRRYETANGVAADLKRHLAHEPVTACPPSSWYRLRKSLKRNRVAYTASALVVAALVVGLGLSTWMFLRERAAQGAQKMLRDRAERESNAARDAARKLRLQSYAADMKLAHVSVLENNLGRAAELVERWLPERATSQWGGESHNRSPSPAGEEDLRGIEWRYLWQVSRSRALQVFRHEAIVNAATLSGDGRWLATGTIDNQARIWDVDKHMVVAQFDGAPENHGLAWSPDGRFIAVGGTNRFAVRESGTWQVVHEWPGVTYSLAWSPDGGTVATVSGNMLKLWNTSTWESADLITNVFYQIKYTFSSDGRWLVAGLGDLVGVWDVSTHSLVHYFSGVGRATAVALSPDKRWLAAGTVSGYLFLWDLPAGHLALTTNAHPAWVFGTAFSPDGKQIVTGGADQVISFWETPTNPQPSKLARLGTLKGHASEIWGLEFSRDGKALVSASKDGTACLWPAEAPPEEERSLQVPPGEWLGFTSDGQAIRMLRPDGSALDDRNLRDGSLVRSLPLPAGICLPDASEPPLLIVGERAWLARRGGMLELWDLAKSQRLQVIEVTNRPWFPIALSADGKHMAVRERGTQISLWNTATSQREAMLRGFMSIGGQDASRMAFSPNSRFFAYASSNYLVKVWDIPARRELYTLGGHIWFIYALVFSPNSELLATSGWDGRIHLWATATGQEAVPQLTGHLGGVRVMQFTSDGRTLLAADDAGSVRAWHVATGREVLAFAKRSAQPPSIASPDESRLLFDGPDGAGRMRLVSLPALDEIDGRARANRRAQYAFTGASQAK